MKRLSSLLVLAFSASGIAADVNTSNLSENNWFSDDTRADGTGAFAAGTNLVSDTLTDDPEATLVGTAAHDADIVNQILFGVAPGTVPAATWPGSVRLRIGNSGGGKSQISDRKDDGIGHGPGSGFGPSFTAEYSWLGTGTPSVTASLKFGIKTADFATTGISSRTGENAWDKVLIYEPGQGNGVISDGVWHTATIDFTTGRWWFFDRTVGASIQSTPMTLSEMSNSSLIFSGSKTVSDVYTLITSPGAHITSVQFGVGSGNANADVYVNQLQTSVYRAGSTTTFGPPPQFATTGFSVGTAPCDVIAVDLDGDGAADIATADSGSDSVTVLFNDGTGSFPTSTTIALMAGDEPAAISGGNLFAGGGLDLVVANKNSDSVTLISNDPVGTFTVMGTLSTSPATEPVSIAAADLDGIAPDDVVIAAQGDLLVGGTGSVMVSLNGAAFASLAPPSSGFLRPQSVITCDLDGDGDLDIVATIAGSAFSPTVTENILLYENNGVGAFAPPVSLSVSQNPRGICCGDLDGDGDVDLAVTAESFPLILPGSVEVFLNDTLSAGTWSNSDFSSGGSFSGGTSPYNLACGDLRDDSIPGFCSLIDIVSVNFGSENLTRYDGYGSGSFGGQNSETAGAVPIAVVIAELNGDKTLDLVVANKASNDVSVLLATNSALAKTFGTGCVGINGTPTISAVGSPTLGNPVFGVAVSNARPLAPALLGVSLGQATTTLGGCQLYLLPPLVLVAAVTNASGEATVVLPIPGSSSNFVGCDAFFQYFIFDSAGSYNGQFAFSDALRIKAGN